MNALQAWAEQAEWGTKNLVHNLDFIPDNKLDWKPTPEATSALEVVQHLVGAFAHITSGMRKSYGEENVPEPAAMEKPANREEAKQQLETVLQDYLSLLQRVKLEDLGNIVPSPMGAMPFWFLLQMPPIDAIHHHGQISYIQMLLGDAESHFDMSLLPS